MPLNKETKPKNMYGMILVSLFKGISTFVGTL